MSIGAVSRYKFNQSQELVTVQKFAGEQMSVSGYPGQQEFSRKHKPLQKP
jgi:hypothetical protein